MHIVKWTAIIATALILALAAVFAWQYYNEDNRALEQAREASSDQYLELKLGQTRYQIYGDSKAPVVIMVHSFNGFLESWSPNVDALVKAGFRVVTYDLWGRGLSSRPRVDLTLEVFREQLGALIQHLGAQRVDLVGASFGCVIAADYAIHHPDQIDKLVMVGPAGWPPEDGGDNPIVSTPILGDAAFHFFGKAILKPKVVAYLHDPQAHAWAIEEWEKFASYPGFSRASLSILRHSPVIDYSAGWPLVGELGKPTLFIWGKLDVSFPFSNAAKAAQLIPQAEIVGIDGAAHWVNIEKPDEVNEAMIDFLE